jgi:hypothetical protein
VDVTVVSARPRRTHRALAPFRNAAIRVQSRASATAPLVGAAARADVDTYHRAMRRAVLVGPAVLAVIAAVAMLVGAFEPWVVWAGPHDTWTYNDHVLPVLLSIASLIWAVVFMRRTPTVIQGCAALVSALVLLLALWCLTVVGLSYTIVTHKEDTGTVGLAFGLANIGCLTLAVAGVAHVIQAMLTRRTTA